MNEQKRKCPENVDSQNPDKIDSKNSPPKKSWVKSKIARIFTAAVILGGVAGGAYEAIST